MIALELLAAHMVGDFILQTNWMAVNKTKNLTALFIHCALYTICFFPVIVGRDKMDGLIFLLLIFVTHMAVDHARWASDKDWPPKPILVDQTIHIVILAFLGRML